MGYKIVYHKEKPKKYKILHFQVLISMFMLLFALLVRLSWPAGRAYLQNILFSPALSHGAEAMVTLLQNLESGDSVQDAVAVFCQELIYGG